MESRSLPLRRIFTHEFYSNRSARDRIENPAATHAHDIAARETVAAKKRNCSRTRGNFAGGELSRAPERDRGLEETRAGAKGGRASDRSNRRRDQKDRGAAASERKRAKRSDGEVGSGEEANRAASQRGQERG